MVVSEGLMKCWLLLNSDFLQKICRFNSEAEVKKTNWKQFAVIKNWKRCLHDSLFASYVYLLPPSMPSNLYFDCFCLFGPSASQYVNISASPSPCVSFHDISVLQFPTSARFSQVVKTHLCTGVLLLPLMEFWKLVPTHLDRIHFQTRTSEADRIHQSLDVFVCENVKVHVEIKMQKEGLPRHERHPSTSIASRHHPQNHEILHFIKKSVCACVCALL